MVQLELIGYYYLLHQYLELLYWEFLYENNQELSICQLIYTNDSKSFTLATSPSPLKR
jgi:hypothetical protein